MGLQGIAVGNWQHMEAIENQVARLQEGMGRLREAEHDTRAEREGNDGSFIGIRSWYSPGLKTPGHRPGYRPLGLTMLGLPCVTSTPYCVTSHQPI